VTPPRDDGPRWLPRPERDVAAKSGDAPPPAAGAPPVALPVPRGRESTNLAPEALPAQLRVGPWRTYALIAGVALLASFGVAAALYFAARSPTSRERTETATRLLTAGTTPNTPASAALSAAPNPPAPIVPIPSVVPIVPMPSAVPSAAASASAAPSPAADEGSIRTPPEAAGHRVFVDGRYAGDSPGPITVRCGQHLVKVGSGGSAHAVDVPCGGDVLVLAR
jgi:hypothetical protein